MYFSLVNRRGCIILSLTPPAPNFHRALILSLLRPPCLLSLAVQRTDWGYYFTWSEFFCHAVIAKVPSCVQDKSKHFSTAAINAQSFPPTVLHFPPLAHPHLLSHFLPPFLPEGRFSVEGWHQIAFLRQSPPLGGLLNLMCISFQD